MSQLRVKKPIYEILTESTSYPYTPSDDISGISITNDGTDTVTVVVDTGNKEITIKCTIYGRSYDGDFKSIKSINVTTGTTYQIELRGIA